MITSTPAPIDTASVSTVRTPNRVSRSGSTSASGSCSSRASRTSPIRPRWDAGLLAGGARHDDRSGAAGRSVARSSPVSTRLGRRDGALRTDPDARARASELGDVHPTGQLGGGDVARLPAGEQHAAAARARRRSAPRPRSARGARVPRGAPCAAGPRWRRALRRRSPRASTSRSGTASGTCSKTSSIESSASAIDSSRGRAHPGRGGRVAEQGDPLGDLAQRHHGPAVDAAQPQRAPPPHQHADHLAVAVQREHVAPGAVVVDHRVDPLVGVPGQRDATPGRRPAPRRPPGPSAVTLCTRMSAAGSKPGPSHAVDQHPAVGALGLHAGRVPHARCRPAVRAAR